MDPHTVVKEIFGAADLDGSGELSEMELAVLLGQQVPSAPSGLRTTDHIPTDFCLLPPAPSTARTVPTARTISNARLG